MHVWVFECVCCGCICEYVCVTMWVYVLCMYVLYMYVCESVCTCIGRV